MFFVVFFFFKRPTILNDINNKKKGETGYSKILEIKYLYSTDIIYFKSWISVFNIF